MFEILVHIFVGMLIGWHVPQPKYVTAFFDSEFWTKIKVTLHWPMK